MRGISMAALIILVVAALSLLACFGSAGAWYIVKRRNRYIAVETVKKAAVTITNLSESGHNKPYETCAKMLLVQDGSSLKEDVESEQKHWSTQPQGIETEQHLDESVPSQFRSMHSPIECNEDRRKENVEKNRVPCADVLCFDESAARILPNADVEFINETQTIKGHTPTNGNMKLVQTATISDNDQPAGIVISKAAMDENQPLLPSIKAFGSNAKLKPPKLPRNPVTKQQVEKPKAFNQAMEHKHKALRNAVSIEPGPTANVSTWKNNEWKGTYLGPGVQKIPNTARN